MRMSGVILAQAAAVSEPSPIRVGADSIKSRVPVGRSGNPREIAKAVVLAWGESVFTVGAESGSMAAWVFAAICGRRGVINFRARIRGGI
jgi:hypothetical protein